jgi:hypothetical protein
MNYIVKLVLVFSAAFTPAVFIAGCTGEPTPPETVDIAKAYDMVGPLEGCSLHYAKPTSKGYYPGLHVVRCPGTATTSTTHVGVKGFKTVTIMIDGVEYEATKKEKK